MISNTPPQIEGGVKTKSICHDLPLMKNCSLLSLHINCSLVEECLLELCMSKKVSQFCKIEATCAKSRNNIHSMSATCAKAEQHPPKIRPITRPNGPIWPTKNCRKNTQQHERTIVHDKETKGIPQRGQKEM